MLSLLTTLSRVFTATLLVVMSSSFIHDIRGQSIDIEPVSSLELIREVDRMLFTSKVEAERLGRSKAFTKHIDKAKSFMHYGDFESAEFCYKQAIATAWNNRNQPTLETEIHLLLDRYAEDEHIAEARVRNALVSMEDGANQIDAMLEFLYTTTLGSEVAKLTLKGQLEFCRHFVETEQFDRALVEYHNVILEYLDPRWTSQLLSDIHEITDRIIPIRTPSETGNLSLTPNEALAEIDMLLEPVQGYFAGNIQLEKGISVSQELISKKMYVQALDTLRTTLLGFESAEWVEARLIRIERIIQRIDAPKASNDEAVNAITYRKEEAEGRIIESIVVQEQNERITYKRVTHNWGGVYYFNNEEPTKDTEWMRVKRMYEEQEGVQL